MITKRYAKALPRARNWLGVPSIGRISRLVLMLTQLMLMLGIPPVTAQDFPSRPIRFVVPYPPGGSGDLLGRLFAEYLSKSLNTRVFVENKPGAATNIALEMLSRAAPDGYTLMLGTGQTMINAVFGPEPSVDPFTAVVSVALIAEMPFVISANPEAGIHSARDMVTKSQVAALTIGHAQFEPQIKLLSTSTGAVLSSIPYGGGAASIMGAIGGQVALVGSYVPVAISQINAGKLRAVGVASNARVAALPDVPTFVEQGFPKFVTSLTYSLLAPKGTPDAVIKRLTLATLSTVRSLDFAKKLRAQGSEPLSGTAADATALMRDDFNKWTQVKNSN